LLPVLTPLYTCNVENDESSITVLQITRNKAAETLLTCSIPQLQANCFIVDA
jgi:hypothetical protein